MSGTSDSLRIASPLKRALFALKDMRAKLQTLEQSRTDPIAIIGLGCRFPGGARDPQAFWELLRDGVDAIGEVPASRWPVDSYFDVDPDQPGKMNSRYGGFVPGADQFDAAFFGIAPREAASMDPQQRLLLEVSWEALEDAGQAPNQLAGSDTGVFIGICTNDYAGMMRDVRRIDAYRSSGNATSIASGRVSYVLGLQGPSVAVDTACSSSLVAVHLACQSLRDGECRMALAGGVNRILTPEVTIAFSKARMLAPDGRCKTFDASANGFVRGEGCGMVILKRLSDAVADADQVLAVIRGTAVNQDGRSNGLTAPNGQAQAAVIAKALKSGRVEPASVQYVEAHGTGTALGDPIEVQALGTALGKGRAADQPLVIGSVKANIGHLEAAAGVAGLIKVVLGLRHAEIPPQVHFQEPSPHIAWGTLPVVVPRVRTPWGPGDRRRIAGVSSFGFGGTNAHVVLEEAPAVERKLPLVEPPLQLLTLSAKSEGALHQLAARFRSHLEANGAEAFGDICFTANTGRAHFAHRLALIAASALEAREKLGAFLRGRTQLGLLSGQAATPQTVIHVIDADAASEWTTDGGIADEPSRTVELPARSAERIAWEPVLERLAQRYIDGATIDWAGFEGAAARRKVSLPTYPFQRQRYWIPATGHEVPASVPVTAPLKFPHPLLGRRVSSPVTAFELEIDTRAHTFINDRRVPGSPVFPPAAYLELAMAAAEEEFGPGPHTLEDIVIHEPLLVSEGEPPTIQTVLTSAGENAGAALFQVCSRTPSASSWTRHASGTLRAGAGEALARERGEAGQTIELPEDLFEEAAGFHQHPTLLTACLQAFARHATQQQPTEQVGASEWDDALDFALARVRRVRIFRRAGARVWIAFGASVETRAGERCPTGDLRLLNELGTVAEFEGLYLEHVGEALDRSPHHLYGIEWQPAGDHHLKPPRQISEGMSSFVEQLAADTRLAQYRDLLPEVNAASRAHALLALRQLGWDGHRARVISDAVLAERLGVCPEQRRLLNRMLEMLALEGVITKGQGGWEVASLPDAGDPEHLWTTLRERFPRCDPELQLVSRCGRHLSDVLRGDLDPLQLLFPDASVESAQRLYEDPPAAQFSNTVLREAIASALQALPAGAKVRILEIGGGTGATTSYLVHQLAADAIEYVFTDVSPLFTARAEQKFRDCSFISYQLLDIERNPGDQGFANQQFDVIVAANVLHATRDLRQSLRHVRQLLAPGGLLAILETTVPEQWMYLISAGLLGGWWRFADTDLRQEHPLLSTAQWLSLLREMGFGEAAAIPESADGDAGLSRQAVLLARANEPDRTTASDWIIVPDQNGVGQSLAHLLRARGANPLLSEPSNPDAWETLLSEIATTSGRGRREFVFLAGLTASAQAAELDVLQQAQQLARDRILRLVQAIVQDKGGQNTRLTIATRGGQAVGANASPLQLWHAPLWGLCRAIAIQHPDLQCGIVDLDPAGSVDDDAATLWQHVTRIAPTTEAAYRSGLRYVPRLVRGTNQNGAARRSSPMTDGACVIANAGKVERPLAQWLVDRGATCLVVIGQRSDRTWMDGLNLRKATVHCVQTDLDDPSQVHSLFSDFGTRYPPLASVSYGIDITEFDKADVADLLQRRIAEAWTLHQVTREIDLHSFLLFSSFASVWGDPVSTHGAAATHFLDALAHYRAARGWPALVLNLPEPSRAAPGVHDLDERDFIAALDRLVGSGTVQAIAADVDWAAFRTSPEAKAHPSLLPRVHAPAAPPQPLPTEPSSILQQLEAAPPDQRSDLLAQFVRKEVAQVLGFAAGAPVDPTKGFFELGMDSLTAVELRNRLQAAVGRSIPAAALFEYPTVGALAGYLATTFPLAPLADAADRRPSGRAGDRSCGEETAEPDDLSKDELLQLLAAELESVQRMKAR